MKHALLLNSNYEFLSFLSERKLIKLLIKDKVEILSYWNEDLYWKTGKIQLPSVIKLKYYVKVNKHNSFFSRRAVLKRDNNSCQYCGKYLQISQITIDHVIPKSKGGLTNFTNCVVSCQPCNGSKSNKTLEESKMTLLRKPTNPKYSNKYNFLSEKEWHQDWKEYLVM